MKTPDRLHYPSGNETEGSISLDIRPSGRCNLDCGYCFYRALGASPRRLSLAEIKSAVRTHLALVGSKAADRISIQGGEPLLDYDLLLKTCRFMRMAYAPGTRIEIFTNGTLLSPERARELFSLGISIFVSIDGCRESHDRNRRFKNRPGGSTFDAIKANLSRLSKDEMARLGAYMTIARNTASRLGKNVRCLKDMGFGRVYFTPDISSAWSAADLAMLRKGAGELRRYYNELIAANAGRLAQLNLDLSRISFNWPETGLAPRRLSEISLAPDGYFYPHCLAVLYAGDINAVRLGAARHEFDAGRARSAQSMFEAFFTGDKDMKRAGSICASPSLFFYFRAKAPERGLM